MVEFPSYCPILAIKDRSQRGAQLLSISTRRRPTTRDRRRYHQQALPRPLRVALQGALRCPQSSSSRGKVAAVPMMMRSLILASSLAALVSCHGRGSAKATADTVGSTSADEPTGPQSAPSSSHASSADRQGTRIERIRRLAAQKRGHLSAGAWHSCVIDAQSRPW